MSQAHHHQPLPDLENALRKMDDVAEYARRKLDKRLARLSDNPPEEPEDDQRATLPSLRAYEELGAEEVVPRLRRKA